MLEDAVGYLNTWSSVSRYREDTGRDPLEPFTGPMREAWGDGTWTVR
jgi:hypothetical protein